MVSQLSAVTLIFLSAAWSAYASKETMSACVTAQEVLYENIELNDAFSKMITGFNDTCHEEGLCTYEIHDETLNAVRSIDASSTISDIAAVKGSGAAHFGGSFYDHVTFKHYRTACSDAGGDVVCIDAGLDMEGDAGAAFLPDQGGIETDIKVSLTSFPVCMTKECENEDMNKILENTAKNAFLNSPKVSDGMDAHTESLVRAATVDQVCALSGLETCELVVTRLECSNKVKDAGSSASHKAAGIATFLAVAVATMFSVV